MHNHCISLEGKRRCRRPRRGRQHSPASLAAGGEAFRRVGGIRREIFDLDRRDQRGSRRRCRRRMGDGRSSGHADRRSAAGSRGTAVQQPGAEMNTTTYRRSSSWGTRLLIALVLILVGAAATWALAQYRPAARFLGVAPPAEQLTPKPVALANTPARGASRRRTCNPPRTPRSPSSRPDWSGWRTLPSAPKVLPGRADALVVAFAARRALDRGVALGYLEPLLVDRFGSQHQQAVGTIMASVPPSDAGSTILAPSLRPWAPTAPRRAGGQLVDQLPPRTREPHKRSALPDDRP